MENSDSPTAAARAAAVAAGPMLTSLVPSTGPAAGGSTVTLNGSGFTGATAVSFGATPAANFAVNSSIKITAISPSGTGAVPVTVRVAGSTSNPLTYTYAPTPTLTGLSPGQGPASGGITVILTGTGLTGATAVIFGSAPAPGYTVNSATQITATSPAGTGAVPVTVTTAGGTTGPVYFFYVSAPSLLAVSPGQGPTSGGTTVAITGTDLAGATAVTFGSTQATSFTVNSTTHITATAPAGTGSVALTVTAPGGTSNSVIYTYVAAPVLTALLPAQGPTAAGAGVTVTGSGLTTTTAVLFGAVPAAYTALSDTTLAVIAPAGAPGPVAVTVTSPGGTSNSLTYTRVPAPEI